MKTAHQILRDLQSGQATTDALGEHLRQPPRVLDAFLQDLELDGHVERVPIANGTLTAWRITTLGLELIHAPA